MSMVHRIGKATFWLFLVQLLFPVNSHTGSHYSDPKAPRVHSEGNRNVLIMGGNGFIGSHLLERLVAKGYNVTTLHRNNTYWQWHSAEHSRVLSCDRNYDLTGCDSLVNMEFTTFLAVVDLSGYLDFAVMQGIQLLTHRFQYYVYLSTDSVYDIVDKRHDGRSTETDGVFPTDKEVRDRLRAGRTYAERKLTSEFIVDLMAAEYNSRYDYSIVRIPDTFGPRDTSYRFWYYMRSLETASSTGRPMRLPAATRDTQVSLAYVGDVAEFLASLVDRYRREAPTGPVKEVFNFAYAETWTMTEFVGQLARAIDLADKVPNIEYTDSASQLYPTVTSGPISVEKVTQAFPDLLQTTPIEAALRASAAFYRDIERRTGEFAKEVARFEELMTEWQREL